MAVNNSLIGALRAEATLESGKFVDGARKIRSEAEKTETTLKRAAIGIKSFGGALTAGLSIGILAAAAKKAIDYTAALKTTAAQLGITTKELQVFTYAAGQVGMKTGEVDRGLQNLGTNLSKAASGSVTAQKSFAAVGVSLDDIKSKSKTEIFGQIADQMIRQGGAAKNAAAGQAIFGDGMSKLIPLLDQGSGGINVLAESAERLGVVLSDQQIQNADETARKLEDVKNVLAAQIAGVVSDNAQSIVTLANALASLTSSIINFLGSNPTLALGILGALAGSRVGGLPGAAAGAFVGTIVGSQMGGTHNPATNQNRRLLQHNLNLARKRGDTAAAARLEARLNGGASSGGVPALPQFLAPKARPPRSARARRGPP